MKLTSFVPAPLALLVLALFATALFATTLVYQLPVTSVIDIGSGGDEPFIQGFSFREDLPDHSNVRWSNGHAYIHLVGLGAQDGTLTLRYAAPRPTGAAHVNLTANDIARSSTVPSADFQSYDIPITRADIAIGGDLNLTLDSDTFSQPPDTRQLGLLFDSARFQSNGAPVIPSPRALLYLSALAVLALFIARAWSGNERAAIAASILTILASAIGLYVARIQTAYFLAPLFWFALFLFGAGYLFSVALKRLTNVLPAAHLTSRNLRLIFLAMFLAFAFRMIFATKPGYTVDVQDYVVWSYKTVTYGLGTMYSALNGLWISDQSPGLNYVLHFMGLLYRSVFAPDFLYPGVAGDPALRGISDNPALLADPIQRTLLRLPVLFADVLTGALVLTTARKYVADKFAWLIALGYWFNPAVLWNGAYWGQTDALHTFLILVCFLLIVYTPRVGLAFFILGIAAFTKPQAMFFGPVLLLAAYKTSEVYAPPSGARDLRGFRVVARAILFGALGSALVLLPVLLVGGGDGLLAYFLDTVGHHPILTANAHNLWWLLFRNDISLTDTTALFPGAPLSFRTFSILLFGIAYLLLVFKAWRAPLEQFFMYGAFVSFAFFMLPTEIHENYGYALLPLLAVALARDARLILLYIAISATMTLNYSLHDPALFERLGLSNPDEQLALARWVNSMVNVVLFAVWSLYLLLRRDLNLSLKKISLRQERAK